MCNNLSVAKTGDKPELLTVSGGENEGAVTPLGSSSQLCPIHGTTRSLSLEDLYSFERKREKQRPRSKRRRSTQIYRENSRKSHRSSSRRKRQSYNQEIPHFLNFEDEIIQFVRASRQNSLEITPQALLRSNSQWSSRRNSGNYPEYPRRDSLASYKKKTSISINLPEEELLKHKRRRKIVTVIIVTFGILVFVCIMAVLVSLTHRSTVSVTRNNSTVNVTYYTFSPHSGVH